MLEKSGRCQHNPMVFFNSPLFVYKYTQRRMKDGTEPMTFGTKWAQWGFEGDQIKHFYFVPKYA